MSVTAFTTLKQAKVNTLIDELNNLSQKHYYIEYKNDKYYLMYKLGYTPKILVYSNTIDSILITLENLVKYRMAEYEEEYYEQCRE